MKMKSKIIFTYLAVLLLFTGCASFPGKQLPNIEKIPPLSLNTNRAKASYSFTAGQDVFEKKEFPENARKHLEDEFVSVLRESGYFASLIPGDQDDEMNIEVRLVDYGTPAVIIPAIITGLSLYTIPSWATDYYKINTKVRDINGNIHKYELEDSVTLVQWLPMIFAFPFNMPSKVTLEVRKNIYKNLILQMEKDGVFSMAKDPTRPRSLKKRAVEVKQQEIDKEKAALVAKNDSRFIDKGNGTVMDTKTGLMWAAKDNGSNIKWADAKSYCDNYRDGGYTDWRMPTSTELKGLYDAGKERPAACYKSYSIHVATDLIDVTCYYLWASETRERLLLGPDAEYLYFIDGGQYWARQSSSDTYRVLPVRSAK